MQLRAEAERKAPVQFECSVTEMNWALLLASNEPLLPPAGGKHA